MELYDTDYNKLQENALCYLFPSKTLSTIVHLLHCLDYSI